MKFKSVDKLNEFSFRDALIQRFTYDNEAITMDVTGAVVRGENDNNSRMEDMYCDVLKIRFKDVKITRLVKEGYKYYDVNDTLVNEVPDQDVAKKEQKEILSQFIQSYIFQLLVKQNDAGEKLCELGVDVEQEEETCTYWITLSYSKVILEWDRYCNPVKMA